MSREEEDTHAFFEQLQGKTPTDGRASRPGVTALREALQAQTVTMRSAEMATMADLDSEEKARMAALKQRLIDQGLLGVPVVPVASKTPRFVEHTSLLQRIRDVLLGDGWQRPVAFAASVIFGILIVLKIAFPPPTEENIMRGSVTAVIVAPDPAAAAESLVTKLQSTGAEVLSVQINVNEWSVRIDVPRTGNLPAVQKILSDAGVQVVGPPPYSVSVKFGR